jgi:hypothetical protein
MTTRLPLATRAAVAVVLVVLAAGCAQSTPSSGGPSTTESSATAGSSPLSGSSSTDAAATPGNSPTQADSTPAQEGTGAESPQPAKKGAPTISVASLPIGGSTDGDGGAHQCADVNLSPPTPLPPGITASIDAIDLSPQGIFNLSGGQCGSTQRCTTSWTWKTDTPGGCTVAVTQVADSSDRVTLIVASTVTCPDQSTCDRIQSEFKGNGSQIGFTALTGVVSGGSTSGSGSSAGASPSDSGSSPSGSPETSAATEATTAGS